MSREPERNSFFMEVLLLLYAMSEGIRRIKLIDLLLAGFVAFVIWFYARYGLGLDPRY